MILFEMIKGDRMKWNKINAKYKRLFKFSMIGVIIIYSILYTTIVVFLIFYYTTLKIENNIKNVAFLSINKCTYTSHKQ